MIMTALLRAASEIIWTICALSQACRVMRTVYNCSKEGPMHADCVPGGGGGAGRDVDLVFGFDFVGEDGQRQLIAYSNVNIQVVTMMCPPYTNFGHWSHLLRQLHPEP